MTTTTYALSDFVNDLRAIASATTDPGEIASRVRPLARDLALAKTWLRPQHYTCDEERGFGVHLLHEEPDHTLFVIAAAWLPGRGVNPHNHGTWAVVAGVDGRETNSFWKRLDDRSQPGHARIRKQGEKVFGPGDVVTLLPDAIHSVRNETDAVTVSLHVYGYNLNLTNRSEFDPEHDVERPVVLKLSGDA
jgi:predicted metal-dependent enzyme (double-stranded beta helix superfamily)